MITYTNYCLSVLTRKVAGHFAAIPSNFCCTWQRCGFTDFRITTALTFTVFTVIWHIRMLSLLSLFLLLRTASLPVKDEKWPILDSQLLSLSLFIWSFNTLECCLFALRFCSTKICRFTDVSLIIQIAISTCCRYVGYAIISFTLDWKTTLLCKLVVRTESLKTLANLLKDHRNMSIHMCYDL